MCNKNRSRKFEEKKKKISFINRESEIIVTINGNYTYI